MMYLRNVRITRFLSVALVAGALPVNAMLMDCSVSTSTSMTPQAECTLFEQGVPSPAAGVSPIAVTPPSDAPPGLAFNPPRSTNPLEESRPLVVFFSIMVTIFLLRTKSLNTK